MPFLYRGTRVSKMPFCCIGGLKMPFLYGEGVVNAIFSLVFRIDLLFHEAYKFHVILDKIMVS